MRYLLMFVGLAGIAIGGPLSLMKGEYSLQVGGMLFLLGTVWGAAGFAAAYWSAPASRSARHRGT
jgi:hypothetical protein